jgi:hypothetical protein
LTAELPGHATLSVKKGATWPGGLLKIAVRLESQRVRVEIPPQRLGSSERGTVKRLLGDGAVERLKAGNPAVLEFAVADASFSFSNAMGRRSSIIVDLEGKPQFAINFIDMTGVEDTVGRPLKTLKRLGEAIASSRGARDAREAWRQALEAAGARS